MQSKSILTFLLFIVVCAVPLFLNLDTMPMKLWDESRLANNAIEMLQNGNWLIPHFEGQPDMWNTKPPLLIWVQVVFMKIFGCNELALRLPSALAGLGTILLVFFFCKKTLQNQVLGYMAALVLVTTTGYVTDHVTRTGDYDAFLIFWTTLSSLLFIAWANSEEEKEKTKLLYFIAISFALAVLTKGIAGLMILPGMFIYLLVAKKIIPLLKNKHTYFALISFLFLAAGYYFLREQYNEGYLQAVWENELGGRYLTSLEGNEKEFYFYFRKMWEGRFSPWLYFIPFALLISFYEKEGVQRFVKILLYISVFYLLVISFSKTSLIWYDAPVYPLLAIVVAVGIEKLLESIKYFMFTSIKNTSLLTVLFLVAVFGQPYFSRVSNSYTVNKLWTVPENLRYQQFIKQVQTPNEYTIFLHNYNAPVRFYKKATTDKKITIKQQHEFLTGISHTFGKGELLFEKDEVVMICETSARTEFQKHYIYKILQNWKSCELVAIESLIQNE